MKTLQNVLDYWFSTPNDYKKWFFSGTLLDNYIKEEFEELLLEIINNNNESLIPKNSKEKLAKIILLDQFPRHIYRNTSSAYKYDNMSLKISLELLDNNLIDELSPIEQIFALMPLQHSESIQHKNILLDFANNKLNTCDVNDENTYLNFIEHTTNHKKVLELFGRYPKRNICLGLESTPEELLYIEENKERQY